MRRTPYASRLRSDVMIPLEDNFNDILGKAQRGLGLSDEQLAAKAGVSVEDVNRAKEGHFDEAMARKMAPVLNLRVDALVASEIGRASCRERVWVWVGGGGVKQD